LPRDGSYKRRAVPSRLYISFVSNNPTNTSPYQWQHRARSGIELQLAVLSLWSRKKDGIGFICGIYESHLHTNLFRLSIIRIYGIESGHCDGLIKCLPPPLPPWENPPSYNAISPLSMASQIMDDTDSRDKR
jgi:hypothetical protein